VITGLGDVTITGAGSRTINLSSKNYITISNLSFATYRALISACTGITLNNCLFKHIPGGGLAGLQAAAASTIQANSCTFVNCDYGAINADGANSIATVRNCVIIGNGTVQAAGLTGTNGGAIDYDLSTITGNNYFPQNNIGAGLTDGGNNLIEVDPGVSYPFPAYFNITLDGHDTAHFVNIANVVNPLGAKITAYIEVGPILTDDAAKADIITLAQAGNEIGIHAWSHTSLDHTHAYTVTTTNADPTLTVDASAKQLILSTTTPGNSVTLDWSTETKSVVDLKAAVSGKGWTFTADAVSVYDTLQLSSFADTGGAVTTFPHDLALDIVAPNYQFWHDEILDTQAWLEALTGYHPVTMAYPAGKTSTGVENWLRDHTDIIGARGTESSHYKLSSLDIYNVKANNSDLGVGQDEETTRNNARHVAVFAQSVGAIYEMYSHFANQVTPAQWGWYVDEVIGLGGTITLFREAMTAIRADHDTADGLVYTKSYTPAAVTK
jgi:peptidoglycan/xylan/chitin deacetylase (PgdA/CDA1 family)